MKKVISSILVAVGLFLIISIFIIVMRIFAGEGEDSWICKDGQWQKHGNPSTPMPSIICR